MRLAPPTLAVAVILAVGDGTASAQVPGGGARTLTDGWRFALERRSETAHPPATGWRPVSVPHVITAVPRASVFAGHVGWYRLRFRAPRARPGDGWELHFAAARRRATVWLNGRRLGASRLPYAPFRLPARGLRDGRTNELLVRVDNRRSPGVREGWWNWGGLTRSVTLVPVGHVVLRDVAVLSDVDCAVASWCRAAVTLHGRAENRGREHVDATVELVLTAPSGREHRTTVAVELPARTRRPLHARLELPGVPELWSPERPKLHHATVMVTARGRLQARLERDIGLRSVRVAGGRLQLNGRALQLRGASIQEDLPGRGAALRDRDVDRIVADLVALGAMITRAHYPLDERLLRRFDAAGILVWSQAPVYHADDALARPGGVRRGLAELRATVLSTRSHPSVLVHSIANELTNTPDRAPATARYIRRAAAMVRALDPSVPPALDIMGRPHYGRQAAYDAVDALGLNVYFGWYRGPGDHSVARHADLAPYLATTRAQYPRQAQLVTEFGAEADRHGPVSEMGTYEFQAEYVSRTLDIVDRALGLDGAIYWTLREFAIKPRWRGGGHRPRRLDTIHNKGLLTYGGRRKPAWFVARQRFAAVRSAPSR